MKGYGAIAGTGTYGAIAENAGSHTAFDTRAEPKIGMAYWDRLQLPHPEYRVPT